MSGGKKLSLLILRDNGVAWRCRMPVRLLTILLVLALLLPPLAGVGGWLAWTLWRENRVLSADAARLEKEWMTARATAERLSNVEILLQRADAGEAGAVLQNLARRTARAVPAAGPPDETASAPTPTTQEGPGHEEFPVVDTRLVVVDNAGARLMGNRKLRVALDLRNPDPKRAVAGSIRVFLITADGQTSPLEVAKESGDFRISRFKRAVLLLSLPPGAIDITNAMIVLEVLEEGDKLAYRNIFPVQR